MQTIVWVPSVAILLFLIAGNNGRHITLLLMPIVSLVVIYFAWGLSAIFSVLILLVPVFFLREVSDSRWLNDELKSVWKAIGVILILVLFVALKNYFGITSAILQATIAEGSPLLDWGNIVSTIGLSFVIFRAIEYLLTPNVNMPDWISRYMLWPTLGRLHGLLSFCLAFPSFSSGPVLRWARFRKDINSNLPIFVDREDLRASGMRLANAFIKFSVLSQPLLLFIVATTALISEHVKENELEGLSHSYVAITAVIYLHFLYINFGAFSDIMIVSGRFIGLKIPENFDRPFSARGFLEFWNHWHLSVSVWFRDWVFTPITRFMVIRGVKSNTTCSVLAYATVFGFIGIWHGRTWPFLLSGGMLALGAIVNQLYRDVFRKYVDAKLGKGSIRHQLFTEWMRALSYYFIALSVLGLWATPEVVANFWLNAFGSTFFLSSIVLVSVYAAFIACVDLIVKYSRNFQSYLTMISTGGGIAIIVTKMVFSIAILWLFSDSTPAFVYENF